jgi:hypothetical protein
VYFFEPVIGHRAYALRGPQKIDTPLEWKIGQRHPLPVFAVVGNDGDGVDVDLLLLLRRLDCTLYYHYKRPFRLLSVCVSFAVTIELQY